MQSSTPLRLYPGERAVGAEGVPLVVHERQGAADRPLLVFLPGAIHLARIAYGHPSSRAEDFLAHWVEDAGHSFLAVSYPAEVVEPVFEVVDPHLGLAAYNEAVAAHIAQLVKRWSLDHRVVVLGWSAAGNSAPGLAQALERRNVDLALFVSLAATPPLPNLVLGSLDGTRSLLCEPQAFTPERLLAHRSVRSFAPELAATNARYGRVVLSEEIYQTQYVANMPLNLFPGLEGQLVGDEVVVGHDGPLAESAGAGWAHYPLVANLAPTWRTDARHAVTDRANWGVVLTNMLFARYLAPHDLDRLDDATWREVTQVVAGAPDRLSEVIEGGHMFFVGVDGARETMNAVLRLLAVAEELAELLSSLLKSA